MYVRELGPPGARTVLLLHGQLIDGEVWGPLLPRLAAERPLLVPDLPGYGRSPPLAPWTFDCVREAVEAELSRRGVTALDVVGYSLGTYHALALALAGRVRVGRLHLLGTFAGADAEVRSAFRGYAAIARQGADLARLFADLALPGAAWSEAAARAIPGARLEIAPGVGHLPLTQKPEATAESVAAFLLR